MLRRGISRRPSSDVISAFARTACALHRVRAARARDPHLLKALEASAEVLQAMQERQIGRTQRDASTPYGQRVDLTEYSLWREAYRICDEGTPTRHFEWIYGAAAMLAGL